MCETPDLAEDRFLLACSLYNQIVNGRICGDIAVSRAFGDIRFKTKKNELASFLFSSLQLLFFLSDDSALLIKVHTHRMLKKGVDEGRWSEKFVSRYYTIRKLGSTSACIFCYIFSDFLY